MSKFWEKVVNCDHKNLYPDYVVQLSCPTPYCSGHEWHCKDCGVYISECGCGWNNGLSGWSWLREMKREMKRYEKHDSNKK